MEEMYENIKKVNELAKSLGMTIYRIDYGFQQDGSERIHKIVGLNELSERYLNFKY